MTVSSAENRHEPAPAPAGGHGALRSPTVAAALVVAAGSAATLIGAYIFQYIVKIPPCPLCLEQRIPHYIAVPLALVVALAAWKGAPRALIALGLATLALALLATTGIGAYHSGVEWKLWAGPADCTGEIASFGTAGSLLRQMQTAVVVRCDEVGWRFLGLSLAGWNVLISLTLAAIAGWGLVRTLKPAN